MTRKWKWLVILATLTLLAWGYDRYAGCYWLGTTEFTVEFVLTDSDTGTPISGAYLEIESFGGFYEEGWGDDGPGRRENLLRTTDETGIAREVCHRCWIAGETSGLGITDTYGIYLPKWRYRVVAEGYKTGEWRWLENEQAHRNAIRTGPKTSHLQVPISLQKSPPQ